MTPSPHLNADEVRRRLKKEVFEVVHPALEAGWRAQPGKHIRLKCPQGCCIVVVSTTPKDPVRCARDTLRELRRCAFYPPTDAPEDEVTSS